MSNLGCFTCLNCGKVNPVKGHSYTNKYCNNSCQQQHRGRQLVASKVQEWKESKTPTAWAKVPEWIKKYLIEKQGHKCEVCLNEHHNSKEIPLDVIYADNNSYNNNEDNLMLICPNCRSQR